MPFCNFKLAIIELVRCSHIFIEQTYSDSYFVLEAKNIKGNKTQALPSRSLYSSRRDKTIEQVTTIKSQEGYDGQ